MTKKERIINVIQKMDLGINVDAIDDNVPLREQGIDSLDMMTFFLMLETEFDREIPEENIESLVSIKDILCWLES